MKNLKLLSLAIAFSIQAASASTIARGDGASAVNGAIAIGDKAVANSADAIAIGTNASSTLSTAGMFLGHKAGISIGTNAYSHSDGIHIGHSDAKPGARNSAIVIGSKSSSDGLASTVLGTNSKIDSEFAITSNFFNPDTRGAASTALGYGNEIKIKTSARDNGVAITIAGAANKIEDSNAVAVLGTGNIVKGAYKAGGAVSSFPTADQFSKLEFGSVAVLGGSNKVTNIALSSITGVGNTVTGTATGADIKKLNSVSGYKNTVTDSSHVVLMGNENTVTNSDKNYIFGNSVTLNNQSTDNYIFTSGGSFDGVKNSVVLGNEVKVAASNENVVSLGAKTEVSVNTGVALGSESVADRAAIVGASASDDADPASNKVFAHTTATDAQKVAVVATVKGELAAISVGNSGATRQIINLAAGSADTDAVNVAQLKSVSAKVEQITHVTNVQNQEIRNITNVVNQQGSQIVQNTQHIHNHQTIINEIKGEVEKQRNELDLVQGAQFKLSQDYDKFKGGIAGATAIAFLQQARENGENIVSASIGGYKNAVAIAVGVAGVNNEGDITYQAGVSLNNKKDLNWGAGIGYRW